ncbi:MAG: hypothetical protein SVV80_07960 [Planctomycetota bacterium]|nr:hypothetical protein [Planctomycetota bacterium]
MSGSRKMVFQRLGRCRHLKIATPEDLAHILELDEAHWVATGAPIETINCDRTFLKLMDTDNNDRLMCFEVRDAIAWLMKNLRDRSGMTSGSTSLLLDAINIDQAEGGQIRESASKILAGLDLSGADEITLEQVRRAKVTAENRPVSETGVVLPDASEDDELRQFITDIIATVGGAAHPCGKSGVDRKQLGQFLSQVKVCLEQKGTEQVGEGQTESPVMPLGAEKLNKYLDERFRNGVKSLIAGSAETASVMNDVRRVEKLILYQAHLLRLANNFVSFPHLYDPASRAMFEMGTLVMDGRRFNFSARVKDRPAHSEIARQGNMYVLYAEIVPIDGHKYEIATAVTSGGKGNLFIGKRGVFEDVAGRESDARIVEIIENPISLNEALVSPFKRLGRALTGKIEAMTTSAEKKLDTITTQEKAPSAPSAGTNRGLLAGGLLMGGGVAVAALGSAFAYISKTLAGIEPWKIFLGIGIAILAVMLPTIIVAMLKLRRRDLSAILEGAGWAINARMRLTRRQSRFFTRKPHLP